MTTFAIAMLTPKRAPDRAHVGVSIEIVLHTYPSIKMEQTVFRKVDIQNSDARELPRRKHTTFRTLRKFEIKSNFFQFISSNGHSIFAGHVKHHTVQQA
jgi:hypothetical protein